MGPQKFPIGTVHKLKEDLTIREVISKYLSFFFITLDAHYFIINQSNASTLAYQKKKVSLIRKYYKHALQTNPRHREEDNQF